MFVKIQLLSRICSRISKFYEPWCLGAYSKFRLKGWALKQEGHLIGSSFGTLQSYYTIMYTQKQTKETGFPSCAPTLYY